MNTEADLLNAIKEIHYELAALLPDPSNPDWMSLLTNGNSADAKCLQNVWDITENILKGMDDD